MSNLLEHRKYNREQSVVFQKTKEQFGGLSNMASNFPLNVNGLFIFSSEALYQICRFPHLPDVQKLILAPKSPMTAKMIAKSYRSNSRPDWERIKIQVMRWCLQVKLAQHWTHFSTLLLSTGDQPIVEQSYRDDFWGAKLQPDGVLIGTNILGRLLVELREALREIEPEKLYVVTPPSIDNFLLLGWKIEDIVSNTKSADLFTGLS